MQESVQTQFVIVNNVQQGIQEATKLYRLIRQEREATSLIL